MILVSHDLEEAAQLTTQVLLLTRPPRGSPKTSS
jgi:ABC-type nitrate/sulfonate/bicarbonate transport system ATPase subunit